MPTLFRDNKLLAELTDFEHQMVVVQMEDGEVVDMYGVACGPFMLLFDEDELEQLVVLAHKLKNGLEVDRASPAAAEARALISKIPDVAQPATVETTRLFASKHVTASNRRDN